MTYAMIWAAYGFRYSAAKDPARAAKAEAELIAALGSGPENTPENIWCQPGHLPIEWQLRRKAAMEAIFKLKPDGATEADIQDMLGKVSVGPGGKAMLFIQHHKLLPEAYVYGFAFCQAVVLQAKAYLLGEFSNRGFPTYFLWTFLLKTPLVSMGVMAAGVALAFRRREPWATRMAFLAIPILLYWAMALHSSINIGHRYLLPVYPFLFVLAGGVALALGSRAQSWKGYALLAAIAVSGSVVFAQPWHPALVAPHYLAYFNELAFDPTEGSNSLADSNLDWGQDCKNLSRWVASHPLDKPLYLSLFGMADPRYYGIPHISPPTVMGPCAMEPSPYLPLELKGRDKEAINQFMRDLRNGSYFAISATNKTGVTAPIPQMRAVRQQVLSGCVLVDRVGYSIFIYKAAPLPEGK